MGEGCEGQIQVQIFADRNMKVVMEVNPRFRFVLLIDVFTHHNFEASESP